MNTGFFFGGTNPFTITKIVIKYIVTINGVILKMHAVLRKGVRKILVYVFIFVVAKLFT